MKNQKLHLLGSMLILCLVAGTAQAREVYLFLKANDVPVNGESTVSSMGRGNSIECYRFEVSLGATITQAGGLGAPGKPLIVIRKTIDASSPLLAKALVLGESIQGEFRFYRPNPAGDGTTEQYYTVAISNARIVSQRQYESDSLNADTAHLPALEEIAFTFQTIRFNYLSTGTEYQADLTLTPEVLAPSGGEEDASKPPSGQRVRPSIRRIKP